MLVSILTNSIIVLAMRKSLIVVLIVYGQEMAVHSNESFE